MNERVNHNKEPKSSWFNVLVLENTALPPPKMRKIEHEASVDLNPILPHRPNTSPINISEDELTELKGGDTDSPRPIITLSNVSTSPEPQTLDPTRDVPRSELSGEARQLSGNSSSDEPERVFHTLHPSQGSEGNMGSPMPHLTLPTSPLPEGTFRLQNWRFHPPRVKVKGKCLARVSSDEPSTIFPAGTSDAQAGMSVSDTPTERMSVHKSPQTLKPSVRAQSDTPTELASETPQIAQPINLDNYVMKEKFVLEISKRDQEIASLKTRLQLTEVNVSLTQAVVHDIQEQLAALLTPPISSFKDYSTEGRRRLKKKLLVQQWKGRARR